MGATRRRIDAELVRLGLAGSRESAQQFIKDGRVTVDGAPVSKPAYQVATSSQIKVAQPKREYASRGAHKLIGALAAFRAEGFTSIDGRRCLDAGASTGGFTDVLLKNGAAHVIAADVGYGQLVWSLTTDERVTVMDRTNVRHLTVADLPYRPSLIVADLSFISLTKVLPALASVLEPGGDALLMVKPQFEVGKDRLGKGGVVRDPSQRIQAVESVIEAAKESDLGARSVAASPLPGPNGNVEYFVWFQSGPGRVEHARVESVVQNGPQ